MNKQGANLFKAVGLIVLLLIGANSKADHIGSNQNPAWLKHNAPQIYTVKPNDTLWDIAGHFLQEPWRWREIWQHNSQIEDPDLIYPGDLITLVKDGDRFYLQKAQATQITKDGVHRLEPNVRYLPADKAIETIAWHVISPFFSPSKVVSDFEAKHCPKIIAVDEDHLLVGVGDRIYAKGLGSRPNSRFSIFRPTQDYRDPISGKFLGVEGLVLGQARVELSGNPTSLIIDKSYAEIKVGDRLIENETAHWDPYFTPKYPQGFVDGRIISVFGGVSQIGQYQVVVITGGLDAGRQVGDVLGVYQTQKDMPSRFNPRLDKKRSKEYHFPPLTVGRAVVFRPFERVSYALVTNATRPIYLNDEVGVP